MDEIELLKEKTKTLETRFNPYHDGKGRFASKSGGGGGGGMTFKAQAALNKKIDNAEFEPGSAGTEAFTVDGAGTGWVKRMPSGSVLGGWIGTNRKDGQTEEFSTYKDAERFAKTGLKNNVDKKDIEANGGTRVRKGENGWTEGAFVDKKGNVQKFGQFYDEGEAYEWLYGQLRFEFGKDAAENMVGSKLGGSGKFRK